ncbi:hypothetical protein [Paractinoplanes brasiliensis]|uniref:Uncharacterized protein n=1 Tax=Paractinoplanes brasiliensis TaxID=52695 RepID=A0A4R6J8T1_9ACTN|nr:hypothetical protein [Actinoplanes brasiliensis]TDO32010.1 hypothetical protein C8E87_7450 [Actinoplanes brasiliensis]GID28055.1 hypothetical protein Abr02nite_30380 [Actinoplanes brasiliensis]
MFEGVAEGVVMAGLSTDELKVIRDGLASGRKPRVQFTEAAGQVAGQIGQVVGLGDPAESDEWVTVRFGRDELPFSPGDLRVAPKGAVARKAVPPPAPEPEPAPAGPVFVLDQPAPARKAATRSGSSSTAPAPVSSAPPGAPAPAPRKPAARAAKQKPAPALTVVLAYGEGEWTVAASQGSKALAKPYVIRPAEALRMVALVDVPGVQEAVEQIMAAERAEAEEQARRLREQLAEVEARLAELGEKP